MSYFQNHLVGMLGTGSSGHAPSAVRSMTLKHAPRDTYMLGMGKPRLYSQRSQGGRV